MKNTSTAENTQHITLYRKYRPQKFSEVKGQDHIVDVLTAALKSQKIAHAYLFSGGRGTGKTSIARIFARELGVEETDIYEIDAASNRGIDDIRELRDGVRALPFSSPYKVYIVDEVHMLTKEAFNALLKTLEEPPAHAIFILATTEKEKIPETIASRCQCFEFKKPTLDVLRNHIQAVSKKEGFILEAGVADIIATLGDGSFRDTLGMLEKATSVSKDGELSLEEVRKALGAPKVHDIAQFVEAFCEKNAQKALESLGQLEKEGADALYVAERILSLYRATLRSRFDNKYIESAERQFSEVEVQTIRNVLKNPAIVAQIDGNGLALLIDAVLTTRRISGSYAGLELATALRIA